MVARRPPAPGGESGAVLAGRGRQSPRGGSADGATCRAPTSQRPEAWGLGWGGWPAAGRGASRTHASDPPGGPPVYIPLWSMPSSTEVIVDWRSRITLDPKVLVGKPVLRGTRLAVG